MAYEICCTWWLNSRGVDGSLLAEQILENLHMLMSGSPGPEFRKQFHLFKT